MAVGREQSIALAIVVVGATGTGTFTNVWALARWIRVQPIAETDTYSLTIKDADGIIMLSRSGQVGTYSEKLDMSLGIMRTITIASATQDGTYQCRLDMH